MKYFIIQCSMSHQRAPPGKCEILRFAQDDREGLGMTLEFCSSLSNAEKRKTHGYPPSGRGRICHEK